MKEQTDFSELKNKITVKTTGEFKNIELTDEQYVRLITLLKIGLRIVGVNKNDINVPLFDIDQYISSYAEQFNSGYLVELSDTFGLYFCTEALSLEMDKINEIYGGEYIQKELSHRLAIRDLLRSLPVMEVKTLEEVLKEIEATYNKEFEKNGLNNITITGQKHSRL
jgi:hypothetical protein